MSANGLDSLMAELACGDDVRAEQAVRALSQIPHQDLEELLPALHSLAGSNESDRRWWAARALAEIRHPRVPGWLVERLDDPQAAVRQCAALGLAHQPSEQALPALLRSLNDTDALVARLAGMALSAIGDAALQPLIEVASSESSGPHARREAARALSVIADPRAVPILYELLEDDSPLLGYWAEQGLERMGVGMMFFKP